jgi:hypothetical protein
LIGGFDVIAILEYGFSVGVDRLLLILSSTYSSSSSYYLREIGYYVLQFIVILVNLISLFSSFILFSISSVIIITFEDGYGFIIGMFYYIIVVVSLSLGISCNNSINTTG